MSEIIEKVSSGDTIGTDDLTKDGSDSKGKADSNRPVEDQSRKTLHLDQVFGVLKNQRRRYVLQYMRDSDGQVTLSEISEQIAAWENDKDVRQISSSERKRVYVGLYQCHLPKMDGMGVVAFNKPRGLIELTDGSDILYEYLDNADGPDASVWNSHSMALSGGGTITLGFALLVESVSPIPVVEAAIVSLIMIFLIYSVIGLSRNRTNEDTVKVD